MFKKVTLAAFFGCALAVVLLSATSNSTLAQSATAAATAAGTQSAAPQICGPLASLVTTPATPDPTNAKRGPIVYVPKSVAATYWLAVLKGVDDRAKQLGYTTDYQGPAEQA